MMIPLSIGDDGPYRETVASIRTIRAAARQCYAVLFAAQVAGAEIQLDGEGNARVKPINSRSKAILAEALGKTGKAPVYEVRQYVLDHLCPTVRSFVFDDLRRRVWTRWQARDPEFPRAGMGWLALQNVRGLAAFRFMPVGFPAAVLRKGALTDHRVTLQWDREIGPVEFRIGTLDPGRWHRWKRIVAGEIDHGTVCLNERDGRLSLLVAYEASTLKADLDPERALTVRLTKNAESLALVGPDGVKTYDSISFAEVTAWLTRLKRQQDAWEERLGACGSPRKPWGETRRFRAVSEHRNRVTQARENGVRTRNHSWSKRVATRAADWRCGAIRMDIPEGSEIGGHSWGWYHLAQVIEYKVRAIGGEFSRKEKGTS